MAREMTSPIGNSRQRVMRHSGMTLIELLLVLAISSMMIGIGYAAFSTLGSQHKGMSFLNKVDAIIRSTRNYSISQSSTSFIILDNVQGTVLSVSKRPIGIWRMEEIEDGNTPGAMDRDGLVNNAAISPDGRYGNCMTFGGSATVTMEPNLFYKPDLGFLVSVWVRPAIETFVQDVDILEKKDDFRIYLEPNRIITVEIEGHEESSIHQIPARDWTHLQIAFDGIWFSLRINGETDVIMDLSNDVSLTPDETGFTVGNSFIGSIDELQYSIFDRGEEIPIPKEVALQFTLQSSSTELNTIYFNEFGQLDTRVYAEFAKGIKISASVQDQLGTLDTVQFLIDASGGITRDYE